MEWPDLSWIDAAMLGVLVLSMVVGFVRGLVLELLSLAGWFAAWFGAIWLEPVIAPWLQGWFNIEAGSALNRGAAFVVGFVVVLIVWGLAARLLAMLVKATPLKPLDRLLGAMFGLLRGLVVLLVAATLVAWSPAARSAAWQSSIGAAALDELLRHLLPLLPVDLGPPRRESASSAGTDGAPGSAPARTLLRP